MTAWRTKPVTELETTLQAESCQGPASQPQPLVTLHCEGGTEAWAEDIAWLLLVYTNTEIYTPNNSHNYVYLYIQHSFIHY